MTSGTLPRPARRQRRGELSPAVLDQAEDATPPRASTRSSAGSARRRSSRRRWPSTSCSAASCATEDPTTLTMVTTTLDAMAAGGIYDHVGGGFARYSTDAYWLVPHFEKMLYDQALLVGAYLRAFLVTGERALPARRRGDDRLRAARPAPRRRRLLLRRGRRQRGRSRASSTSGASRSSPRCAATTPPEVIRAFGVTAAGNFRDPHTGYSGNILHLVDRAETTERGDHRGASGGCSTGARRRVRPGLDDKVLLGWNALFLRSLAEAAAAFDRRRLDGRGARQRRLPRTARCAATTDGCSGRGTRTAGARHLAVAEDYAALLEALRHAGRGRRRRVARRRRATCADDLFRLFHDDESGGFFTTGSDAEALIVRPQDFFDNATPSENSLAADGLLRLAALTGDHGARGGTPARADAALAAVARRARLAASPVLLGAYERAITPPDRDRARRRTTRRCAGRGVRPPAAGVGGGAGRARRRGGAHSPARRPRARRRPPDRLRLRAASRAGSRSPRPRPCGPSSTPRSTRRATQLTALGVGQAWPRPLASASAVAQPNAMTASPLVTVDGADDLGGRLAAALHRARVEHRLAGLPLVAPGTRGRRSEPSQPKRRARRRPQARSSPVGE